MRTLQYKESQNHRAQPCLMCLWELFLFLSHSALASFGFPNPNPANPDSFFPPRSTSLGYNWEIYVNHVHIANKKIQVFVLTGNRFGLELFIIIVGWSEFWEVYICLLWFWFYFSQKPCWHISHVWAYIYNDTKYNSCLTSFSINI